MPVLRFKHFIDMEFPEFLTHDSRTVVIPKYFQNGCGCAGDSDGRKKGRLGESDQNPLQNYIYCSYGNEQLLKSRHTSWSWGRFRRRSSIQSRLKFNFKRLADLIVFSTYFLSLVSTTTSSPLPLQDMESPPPPRWTCPCGDQQELDNNEFGLVNALYSERELLEHIIVQGRIALDEANRFKHNYILSTFGVGFQEYHRQWRINQLSWLPSRQEIPKELGERAEDGHLERQDTRQALSDIYEYLQRIAVGLEQVVADQVQFAGEFVADFNRTNNKLMQVLCEIQMAMRELSVERKPDVTRDIMSSEIRNLDSTSHRNVRDWLIFRDYMNSLEYMIQVFESIRERTPL